MRIGPIEINWSPRHFNRAWHRAPLPAKNINFMTPTELRKELVNVLRELDAGRSPYIPKADKFQRIHFFDNNLRK